MKSMGMVLAVCFCIALVGWTPCFAGKNVGAGIALSSAQVTGDTLSYRVLVSSAVKTTGVLVQFQMPLGSLEFVDWENGSFVDDPLTFGQFENEEAGRVMVAVATTNKFPMTRSSGEVGTARFVRTAPGDGEVVLAGACLSDDTHTEDWIVRSTEGQVPYSRPRDPEVPARFALRRAGPNPVMRTTLIQFDVPRPGADVKLKIYNVRGREVCTLLSDRRAPGYYSKAWDGTNTQGARVAPGVYFCRMEAGEFRDTRKLVLLK